MPRYDQRTVPQDRITFYVWDDLRYQQNRESSGREDFDLFYFDTLEEALEKFKDIPAWMTPALGMSWGMGEWDIIYRREGYNVLSMDYYTDERWRNNPEVQEHVDHLCSVLNVAWVSDPRTIPHATILVPKTPWFQWLPDRAVLDKVLRPRKPQFYRQKPTPLSAINEVFCQGDGWLPYEEFRVKAEKFGWESPHCLKVHTFNVNYTDSRGHEGQIDVSPGDFRILLERYTLQHGEPEEVQAAAQKLAAELDEFIYQFDTYEYKDRAEDNREESVNALRDEILEGRTEDIISYFQLLVDENEFSSDEEKAAAHNLLARVEGLSRSERKPELDKQISVAAEQQAKQKHHDAAPARDDLTRE